jgi:hypothetical protein
MCSIFFAMSFTAFAYGMRAWGCGKTANGNDAFCHAIYRYMHHQSLSELQTKNNNEAQKVAVHTSFLVFSTTATGHSSKDGPRNTMNSPFNSRPNFTNCVQPWQ